MGENGGMDWVTVIWAAVGGGGLVLALLHGVVWCRNRESWANLWFSLMVFGVVALVLLEIGIMRTRDVDLFEAGVRWGHAVYLVIFVASLGLVRSYFRAGGRGMLVSAVVLRVAAVVANFTTGANLHFVEVISLRRISFLGQEVTVPGEWVANRWMVLGQVASLAWLVYVLQASWHLRRTGTVEGRRRAVLLGGGLAFFIVFGAGLPGVVAAGLVEMPMNASLAFLGMVFVLNYELGGDLLRAARIAADLETTKRRLALAAAAGRLAIWEWDIPGKRFWVSDEGRQLYGVSPDVETDMALFLSRLHPDDREEVQQDMADAVEGKRPFRSEYRVVMPDGQERWIAATGRTERDVAGRVVLMRGVSIDCTDRKRSELETELQRSELRHLSRVSLMGEMSGALAHELNQPLTAMLNNAEVGRRMLEGEEPDWRELGAILDDIVADAKRAGGVIHGVRAMLRKEDGSAPGWIDVNEAVQQALAMVRGEIRARGYEVVLELDPSLPPVRAGRVVFQQVLINLLVNGMEAMRGGGGGGGTLTVATWREDDWVGIAVRDTGPGIAVENLDRIFDPFFTLKSSGLGLGLSISRGIVDRLGGGLVARNHPSGGAELCVRLPAGEGAGAAEERAISSPLVPRDSVVGPPGG